jgi:hypothetical protein
MQLHELLGQRQAEPRALLRASVVPADLAELLEDGRLVLGRDPDPRVADGDGDEALGRRDGDAHPASLRGELHGIGRHRVCGGSAWNQKIPHPRRERQARTRAASCGIEKGLVR